MQTKTIFRPALALALLFCGVAMLGLGLWSSAAGQGQTPILFSENPEGFNECISNYGVFAPVGDDGDAQCTPRPPGWTPPAPVVAPDPGGIEVDEPDAPSPPSIPVTITPPPGLSLRYDVSETCEKFGGKLENSDRICSEIDINDTFCIVGSKDALPCRGLFIHVHWCNYYNRPALDPFHCAGACDKDGEYACGRECLKGEIHLPEQRTISGLLDTHRDLRFTITVAMAPSQATLWVDSTIFYVEKDPANFPDHSLWILKRSVELRPPPDGSEKTRLPHTEVVTFHAELSCGQLDGHFGVASSTATITSSEHFVSSRHFQSPPTVPDGAQDPPE